MKRLAMAIFLILATCSVAFGNYQKSGADYVREAKAGKNMISISIPEYEVDAIMLEDIFIALKKLYPKAVIAKTEEKFSGNTFILKIHFKKIGGAECGTKTTLW